MVSCWPRAGSSQSDGSDASRSSSATCAIACRRRQRNSLPTRCAGELGDGRVWSRLHRTAPIVTAAKGPSYGLDDGSADAPVVSEATIAASRRRPGGASGLDDRPGKALGSASLMSCGRLRRRGHFPSFAPPPARSYGSAVVAIRSRDAGIRRWTCCTSRGGALERTRIWPAGGSRRRGGVTHSPLLYEQPGNRRRTVAKTPTEGRPRQSSRERGRDTHPKGSQALVGRGGALRPRTIAVYAPPRRIARGEPRVVADTFRGVPRTTERARGGFIVRFVRTRRPSHGRTSCPRVGEILDRTDLPRRTVISLSSAIRR